MGAPAGRSRLTEDRGAVIVEAALLVPILLVLMFAVIEWGLMMRDTLSVTESTQVGARTASAMPRQPDFTKATVDAIARAGSALPKSQIVQILVYKANDLGYPGPDGSTTMSCAYHEHTCDRYVWDSGSQTFVLSPSGSSWDPRAGIGNVNACAAGRGGPPDSVGVYVEAVHPWATRLFGTTRTLRGHAVLPFEPMPVGVCQ